MSCVVVRDPIPGGAMILGSAGTGLGRDSQIATSGEKKPLRSVAAGRRSRSAVEAFRSYYEYVPKAMLNAEYTVRLNNVVDFALPPSRVEALYVPEMFGEAPKARVKVEPAK